MVEKQFEQHNGNVDETLFSLLCMWCGGKGATWGTLLQALRAAKLNAQTNCLLEWGESGGALVSFIYGGDRERCMYRFAAVREGSECWLNVKLLNCHSVLC